jgi:hypothetical protein
VGCSYQTKNKIIWGVGSTILYYNMHINFAKNAKLMVLLVFQLCLLLYVFGVSDNMISFLRQVSIELLVRNTFHFCGAFTINRWSSSLGAQWWWRCGLCGLGEQTSKTGFSVLSNSEVGWLEVHERTYSSVYHLGRLSITGKKENSVSFIFDIFSIVYMQWNGTIKEPWVTYSLAMAGHVL